MRILFDPLFDLARQFRLLPIFVNTPYEPRLKKDGKPWQTAICCALPRKPVSMFF